MQIRKPANVAINSALLGLYLQDREVFEGVDGSWEVCALGLGEIERD